MPKFISQMCGAVIAYSTFFLLTTPVQMTIGAANVQNVSVNANINASIYNTSVNGYWININNSTIMMGPPGNTSAQPSSVVNNYYNVNVYYPPASALGALLNFPDPRNITLQNMAAAPVSYRSAALNPYIPEMITMSTIPAPVSTTPSEPARAYPAPRATPSQWSYSMSPFAPPQYSPTFFLTDSKPDLQKFTPI